MVGQLVDHGNLKCLKLTDCCNAVDTPLKPYKLAGKIPWQLFPIDARVRLVGGVPSFEDIFEWSPHSQGNLFKEGEIGNLSSRDVVHGNV